MAHLRLWLRWSWRDLRARWLLVAAISLIVAIGTGVYAGLSSTSRWRQLSYDASYEQLQAHDVRVSLADSTYIETERLLDTLEPLRDELAIATAEPRLYADISVDASTAGESILVPGQVVGMDVSSGGPEIDTLWVAAGRGLVPDDEGEPRVVLDHHFAEHHDLPPAGRLRVSGGTTVEYVGQGFTPEYFWVINEGSILADAAYAVMFAPLATAQDLAAKPGVVNDLFIDLAGLEIGERDAAAVAEAAERIEEALADALPDVALEATTLEEDKVRRMLYDDIEGDQRLYNIFAVIILGGAAFAAFNLVGRVVEAQRREIGIGMALGVPRSRLAIRPLLVGFQVALLGAVFGVGVGLLLGGAMRDVMQAYVPLPAWHTPFQARTYATGAALGLSLPFVATILPVWRAVRVDPIDAIKTGPTTAKRSGLAPLVRRLAVGTSLTQMPLRNVLRAPRRTLLTTLAIGASISTLVAVIGMVDSFVDTIDRGDREILGDAPRRFDITIAGEYGGFTLAGSETLREIEDSPVVGQLEPSLRLPGSLDTGGEEPIDVLVTLQDLASPLWRPTAVEGSLDSPEPGVVIAEKAADDLGVGVGDTVTLRHLVREGLTEHSWAESRLPVLAIHANPYRFMVYMDDEAASLMNLEGVYNAAIAEPPPGISTEQAQRDLFELDSVASVQPVAAIVQTIRDAMNEVLGLLSVVDAAVLLLALLIAFNSSSINADERAREHATMFAFGLPTRAVLLMTIVESFVIGVLGTVLGIALGIGLLGWIVHFLLPTTMPDLGVQVAVSPQTVLLAALLGTVAVALAPVFTLRRMRRMDIPATLRVVE